VATLILTILLITTLGLLYWQVSNLISILAGSPFVVSKKEYIQKALEIAQLKKGELLYDLGCGNGEALIAAEKMGAQAVGYEISPFYYWLSKIRTCRNQNISVKFQDIKKTDLSSVDVIYVYLLPKFLEKLAPKFKNELKKGARLISLDFEIEGLEGEEIKFGKKKFYLYRF